MRSFETVEVELANPNASGTAGVETFSEALQWARHTARAIVADFERKEEGGGFLGLRLIGAASSSLRMMMGAGAGGESSGGTGAGERTPKTPQSAAKTSTGVVPGPTASDHDQDLLQATQGHCTTEQRMIIAKVQDRINVARHEVEKLQRELRAGAAVGNRGALDDQETLARFICGLQGAVKRLITRRNEVAQQVQSLEDFDRGEKLTREELLAMAGGAAGAGAGGTGKGGQGERTGEGGPGGGPGKEPGKSGRGKASNKPLAVDFDELGEHDGSSMMVWSLGHKASAREGLSDTLQKLNNVRSPDKH